MKKVLPLLMLLCIMLVGCKKENTFELSEEYYNNEESLIEISNKELKSLENEKKSFAVFVYLPNCTTSSEFNEVLTDFLEKNQISFYKISGLDTDNTKIGETLKFYPSVVIYNEGEIVSYLRSDNDEDTEYYKSVEGFKEWFTKSVSLKEVSNTNNSETSSTINRNSNIGDITISEDKINIYFFWGSGCPRCEELFKFFESIDSDYGKYYNLYAFEVWKNEDNGLFMDKFLKELDKKEGSRTVPYFIIGDEDFEGYGSSMDEEIKNTIIDKYNSRDKINKFETLINNN